MTLLLSLLLVHDESVSSSRWEIEGREIRATFTLRLEDLAALAPIDADRDGRMDSQELDAIAPALIRYFAARFRVSSPGGLCDFEGLIRLPGQIVTWEARWRAARPATALRLRCDLFREHVAAARHVADFPDGATLIFDGERPEAEWTPRPMRASIPGTAILGAGAAAVLAGIIRRRRRASAPPP